MIFIDLLQLLVTNCGADVDVNTNIELSYLLEIMLKFHHLFSSQSMKVLSTI